MQLKEINKNMKLSNQEEMVKNKYNSIDYTNTINYSDSIHNKDNIDNFSNIILSHSLSSKINKLNNSINKLKQLSLKEKNDDILKYKQLHLKKSILQKKEIDSLNIKIEPRKSQKQNNKEVDLSEMIKKSILINDNTPSSNLSSGRYKNIHNYMYDNNYMPENKKYKEDDDEEGREYEELLIKSNRYKAMQIQINESINENNEDSINKYQYSDKENNHRKTLILESSDESGNRKKSHTKKGKRKSSIQINEIISNKKRKNIGNKFRKSTFDIDNAVKLDQLNNLKFGYDEINPQRFNKNIQLFGEEIIKSNIDIFSVYNLIKEHPQFKIRDDYYIKKPISNILSFSNSKLIRSKYLNIFPNIQRYSNLSDKKYTKMFEEFSVKENFVLDRMKERYNNIPKL